MNNTPLSPHDVRRLAVVASIHPKTVTRYFANLPVQSTCRTRIEFGLRRIGRADLIIVEERPRPVGAQAVPAFPRPFVSDGSRVELPELLGLLDELPDE